MNSEHDYEIMSALSIAEEPLTAYAIAKETDIAIPQVTYRLRKLVNDDVVSSTTTDKKTRYEIHPILKSTEKLEEIVGLLTDIITLVDETQAITTDGVKTILAFMVDKIEFEDPENERND